MSNEQPPREVWVRKFCICISLIKALTCREKYLNIARCRFYKDWNLLILFSRP